MFFFKRFLFFLDFKRFRFKKIKHFRLIKQKTLLRSNQRLKVTKEIIFAKKNSASLSLKKLFLKKSLYTNKFFRSRRFFNKKFQSPGFLKQRFFKKKSMYMPKKFFSKFLKIERLFFLKMFYLKHKNQKSTTKFSLITHKYNPFNFKRFIELSILNILGRAKFSLSKKHSLMLISSNVVYVNCALVNRRFFSLKKQDIIQIVFIKSFFFFYRYIYNLVFKKLRKVNYCV
jgi:hypothetical protein